MPNTGRDEVRRISGEASEAGQPSKSRDDAAGMATVLDGERRGPGHGATHSVGQEMAR